MSNLVNIGPSYTSQAAPMMPSGAYMHPNVTHHLTAGSQSISRPMNAGNEVLILPAAPEGSSLPDQKLPSDSTTTGFVDASELASS